MKDNTIKTDLLMKFAQHLSKYKQFERTEDTSLPVLGMHENGSVFRYFQSLFYECPHIFREWTFSNEGLPVLEGTSNSSVADSVMDFFNLDDALFQHLFSPFSQNYERYGGKTLKRSATRREIAFNIRCFVESRKRKLLKIAA